VRKKTVIIKNAQKNKLNPQEEEELSATQWAEYLKQNDSIIGDLLLGQFKTTVICKRCDHSSITFQSGYNLPLEVPSNVEKCNLEQLLQFYMKPEDLEWFCPYCKKMEKAKKKSELFKLPPILIVMLKRFQYDPKS
jgi:ubiquitin C-terminal hydrolase